MSKSAVSDMASSDTPSRIEEKHFGNVGNKSDIKVNDKIATKDFISSETGKQDVTVEPPAQNSIKVELSNKQDLETANENGNNKRKRTDTPDSEIVVIEDVYNYKSINSGLESDVEDNDSDVNPSIEVSGIREPDPSIDDNLPETVTLLKTPDGGKCYIVGTAHFSVESQNDVSRVIQAVQPHIVMVELCLDRIHILQLDEETILKEAKNLNFSKIMDAIKQNGMYKGIFYLLLLNMSAHLTKVLGLAPGGEFRRALQEAQKIPNCFVQMGDRPIKITFARAISSLSWWQMTKLAWNLLTDNEPISQNDVEKYKSRDSLEEMMAEVIEQYPAIGEVFVKERDIYLTYSLQLACKPQIGPNGKPIPARVVAVVGIGHSFGIVENWGKVKRSQIPPILSIPPPSLSSKVLKFTVKASIIGGVIYVGYKCVSLSSGLIQSLKSSVMGLIKVSGS